MLNQTQASLMKQFSKAFDSERGDQYIFHSVKENLSLLNLNLSSKERPKPRPPNE